MDDWELLQEFRVRNSEAAFGALVSQYVGLVYSSALRQVGQKEMAKEVTQAVFALLARKAGSIGRNVLLAGWLFRTTRFVASRAMRTEARRKVREREAIAMQELSTADETWRAIGPLLDEALDNLSAVDRDAVLARFMDDKSLRETGAALGITEDAAKKRVARGLEKLRAFFQRRGFAASSVALAAALSEQLAGAAPPGLALNITSTAMTATGAAAPGWIWTPLKIAAVLAGLGIIASFTALRPWRKAVIAETKRSSSIAAAPTEPARTAAAQPTFTPRLRLRVVSAETGQGLAGARVFAQFWHDFQVRELLTDPNGVCDILLPTVEFGRLDLGALADWHVQKHVMFREKTVWPIPDEFTLKLERAVSAGGWVRDESGRGVPGAEIVFEFPGWGDYSGREPHFERLGYAEDVTIAKTDASGYWACATLPPKYERFTIQVSHPEFLPQGFATDAGDPLGVPMTNLWAGSAVLILKDRRPLSLSGRVTDFQRMPIAGAKVSAGAWTGEADDVTDASGHFQLTQLAPGTNGVTVAAKGFAPERVFVNVTREVAPATIKLKPGNLLRVRVLDEKRSPVQGATVALFEWRDRHAYDWRGNTDAEGIVEWADAPAEPMKFDIFRRGYFGTDEQRLQASGEVHTVLLRRGLRVTGHVIDEETGERIPKFKVIPGYQEADSRQWFRSDVETGGHGYYEFGL